MQKFTKNKKVKEIGTIMLNRKVLDIFNQKLELRQQIPTALSSYFNMDKKSALFTLIIVLSRHGNFRFKSVNTIKYPETYLIWMVDKKKMVNNNIIFSFN